MNIYLFKGTNAHVMFCDALGSRFISAPPFLFFFYTSNQLFFVVVYVFFPPSLTMTSLSDKDLLKTVQKFDGLSLRSRSSLVF